LLTAATTKTAEAAKVAENDEVPFRSDVLR
jgi:hypothetical protein